MFNTSAIKHGVWRRGSYHNVYAPFGVKVFSVTGNRVYWFRSKRARYNFVGRVRRARNFRSVRYLRA